MPCWALRSGMVKGIEKVTEIFPESYLTGACMPETTCGEVPNGNGIKLDCVTPF